ncbi:molybdate ABC transporter substrate-binding protein [Tabrizicola sp. BL-A-41-H6]|uniref:molybdate ABC transporter substrate-binding protein n=1 Tax=Tabrizicola sp. BL-A-41-H6 TaxID=3421107 RepID=UPI003D678108
MSVWRLAALLSLLSLPVSAGEVTVFAASSLKTALDSVAAAWQAETGNSTAISYAGSPALAKQIIAGAPAELFLSAAPEWMDSVEKAGLLRPESRVDLLGNQLVLIAHGPAAAPMPLDASTDLAARLDGGKLSMAMVDSVPAGQYGREALVALGLWDSVKDSVVQSENVRAALQFVALGEAPLGVVYLSDAIADQDAVSIVATFPETSHRPIIYPAALTTLASPEAAAFLDYLSSPTAQALFAAQGFTMLGAK